MHCSCVVLPSLQVTNNKMINPILTINKLKNNRYSDSIVKRAVVVHAKVLFYLKVVYNGKMTWAYTLP